MRILILLLLSVGFTGQLSAQQKDLEYFAKVPSRYVKPGLSPMQTVRFSYQQTPGNQWIKDAGEMKLDLFKVRFHPRGAVIFSGGTWAGYKTQKKNLYEVRGDKAFEKTDYLFVAPTVSAGLSYGFFFPWFASARIGVLKPFEAAYYKAQLPIQYSDGSGIQTSESTVKTSVEDFGDIQKYIAFEIYRPFKARSTKTRPMGLSLSYVLMLDHPAGNSAGAINAGIYWHMKAK